MPNAQVSHPESFKISYIPHEGYDNDGLTNLIRLLADWRLNSLLNHLIDSHNK